MFKSNWIIFKTTNVLIKKISVFCYEKYVVLKNTGSRLSNANSPTKKYESAMKHNLDENNLSW